MIPPPRWVRVALGALASVLLLAIGAVYLLSERELRRTHPVPAERPLRLRSDPATLAMGEHIVHSVGNCVLCHGEDLGGAVYSDDRMLGLVAGPNLTRGRGGVGTTLSDADWERAVRHGVRRDGTSLIIMPSEVYAAMSDEDLGAIVAYVRRLPPVDREMQPTHFRILGRALLAAGKLPLLAAAKTPRIAHPRAVPRSASPAYGRYLATVGGCHGCHGYGLSGGHVAGPPGLPPAANLTPAGIGRWTERDFVRAMRTGTRPDGSRLHDFMPWRVLGRMSDGELHALWLYLRGVPPRPFGNK